MPASPHTDSAAKILEQNWDHFQNTHLPAINDMQAQIGTDLTADAVRSASDATARAHGVTDRMQMRLGQSQIPGTSNEASRQRAGALSEAGAFNNARVAQLDRDRSLMSNLVGIGGAVNQQAVQASGAAAGMEQQRIGQYNADMAAYKQAKAQRNNALWSTAGTIIGAGLGAFGGPAGMMIGAQIGGGLGGYAGQQWG